MTLPFHGKIRQGGFLGLSGVLNLATASRPVSVLTDPAAVERRRPWDWGGVWWRCPGERGSSHTRDKAGKWAKPLHPAHLNNPRAKVKTGKQKQNKRPRLKEVHCLSVERVTVTYQQVSQGSRWVRARLLLKKPSTNKAVASTRSLPVTTICKRKQTKAWLVNRNERKVV